MNNRLKEIYDDIVSTYAQYGHIHNKFLMLNWFENGGGYSTCDTEDVLEQWMIEESDHIQGLISRFSKKLWALPEVNQHDSTELEVRRLTQKLDLIKKHQEFYKK